MIKFAHMCPNVYLRKLGAVPAFCPPPSFSLTPSPILQLLVAFELFANFVQIWKSSISLKGHSTVAVEGRQSEINDCAEGKAAVTACAVCKQIRTGLMECQEVHALEMVLMATPWKIEFIVGGSGIRWKKTNFHSPMKHVFSLH